MAVFQITANATNACGVGSTSGPLNLSVGALTTYGTCPIPVFQSGLSVLGAGIGVAFTTTFRINNCTGGTVYGLPPGLSLTSFDRVTGTGTISGTPTGPVSSNAITFSALNACGGGDATTTTSGIPLGTLTVNPAGGSIVAGGPNTFEAFANVVQESVRVGYQFLSNGTVSVHLSNQNPVSSNWFTISTVDIGNNYWMRATPTVVAPGFGLEYGSPRNAWIPLSSDPIFAITNPSNITATTIIYDYVFEFASDSQGINIVATHTSCTFSLTNEVI